MPNKSLRAKKRTKRKLAAVPEMNADHHWIITLWPLDARF